MNKNESILTAFVSMLIFVALMAAILSHNAYYSNIGKDAVKAGLVQQQTQAGDVIWVKPEDYKPYPISTFDSPRWSR
jgi:hypothetical protein